MNNDQVLEPSRRLSNQNNVELAKVYSFCGLSSNAVEVE